MRREQRCSMVLHGRTMNSGLTDSWRCCRTLLKACCCQLQVAEGLPRRAPIDATPIVATPIVALPCWRRSRWWLGLRCCVARRRFVWWRLGLRCCVGRRRFVWRLGLRCCLGRRGCGLRLRLAFGKPLGPRVFWNPLSLLRFILRKLRSRPRKEHFICRLYLLESRSGSADSLRVPSIPHLVGVVP